MQQSGRTHRRGLSSEWRKRGKKSVFRTAGHTPALILSVLPIYSISQLDRTHGTRIRLFERSRTVTHRYRMKLMSAVPTPITDRFRQHVRRVNVSRARLFTGFIPLFIIVLSLPSDIYFILAGRASGNRVYYLVTILDAAAVLLFIMFWYAMRRYERSGGPPDSPLARFMIAAVAFLVLSFAVSEAILAQYLSGVITAYIVGVFAISVTVFLTLRQSLLVYPLPLAAFLLVLPLTSPEQASFVSHATGAAEVTFVAWIISRLLYAQEARESNGRF
jgi:hypothetical protein